jgi:hypothetical protein
MPRELSLLELDRELGRSVREVRRAVRALHEGDSRAELELPPVLMDPETLERVRASANDALSPAILRWLQWLHALVATLPSERALLREYRVSEHALDRPLAGSFNLRQLLGHALRDRERRPALFALLAERGGSLRDAHARALDSAAQLESSAALRAVLELPCRELEQHAASFLSSTADAYASLSITDLSELIETGLAHGAADGWPRRLELRSLSELLGHASWLDGLRLEPGSMPAPIAPASFMRGFLRLGAAWVDGLTAARVPYALHAEPLGLPRRSYGALFGLLALERAFLTRQLGLGRERARAYARALSASALVFVRQRALELVLRSAALRGRAAYEQAFVEQWQRAFGFELEPRFAGVLLRFRLDAGQRFAGPLLAHEMFEQLVQRHDDDWFRNPRAVEELRAQASLPARASCEPERLDTGARELLRRLTALLE